MKNMREKQKYIQKVEITAIKMENSTIRKVKKKKWKNMDEIDLEIFLKKKKTKNENIGAINFWMLSNKR